MLLKKLRKEVDQWNSKLGYYRNLLILHPKSIYANASQPFSFKSCEERHMFGGFLILKIFIKVLDLVADWISQI